MSLKERIVQTIDHLPVTDLRAVADYLAFLNFRSRRNMASKVDEASLAALYAQFEDEDRQLAEDGMEEYAQALSLEDRL